LRTSHQFSINHPTPLTAAHCDGTTVHHETFRVEGMKVDALALPQASARICDDLDRGKSFSVFTLNLDHIVKLRRDRAFANAYQRAAIVLPDGFPIVLAGRLQGRQVSRTAGSDLILPLCAEAARRSLPVVLFGTTFSSLSGAARQLTSRIEGLEIAGAYSPPPDFDPLSERASESIEFLKNSGARICLLALGAPKQEVFADRCTREIEGMAFICIGAGLDFLAGHQKRAPEIFRRLNCEWLWRLLLDPRRLARRYLECLYVFPSVLLSGIGRRG